MGLTELLGRVNAEDPARLHVTLQEAYHTRVLADTIAMFGLPVPARPPRVLVRLMIHMMVSAPEHWTLPLVGASEMVGCVLFRQLRDKGMELFADEPAVAERIQLLYNEILAVMLTGDFLGMSLTTDNVSSSPLPNAWRIGNLTMVGIFIGVCELIFCTAVLAIGKFRLGLGIEALSIAEHPNFWANAMLAVDYIELGDDHAARAEVAEVLKLDPQFSVETCFRRAVCKIEPFLR